MALNDALRPNPVPGALTLDYAHYVPFCSTPPRDLGKNLSRLHHPSFSPLKKNLDNTANIEPRYPSQLRHEMAHLLGYDTYAELSIARKMAPSVEAVETLMEELRTASYDKSGR